MPNSTATVPDAGPKRSAQQEYEYSNRRHDKVLALGMLGLGLFFGLLVFAGLDQLDRTGSSPPTIIPATFFCGLMIGMSICTWPLRR